MVDIDNPHADHLKLLNIEWKTQDHLKAYHSLAERCAFAVKQTVGVLLLEEKGESHSSRRLWIDHLIQTAVEAVLFPNAMPESASTWEGKIDVLAEYSTNEEEFHKTGVRTVIEGMGWGFRMTVQGAWAIEFAKFGGASVIGPIATDSAHRA